MSSKVQRASAFAVAASFLVTLVSAEGSGAAAWASQLSTQAAAAAISEPASRPAPAIGFVTQPVIQPLPQPAPIAPAPVEAAPADDAGREASSLAELVATRSDGELSRELDCLAGAVYFEAKGESLAGQLAVGRVVVARARSGRFPGSYCGVVFQPSQFSFVRGGAMPGINRASRHWRNAVAIARIAHEGSWQSPVEGALFFHATHVSPGWRLTRMARVDNHVFYR